MQPLNEQQPPVTNQPPQEVVVPPTQPDLQPYQPHPITQAFQAQPLRPFQPLQLATQPIAPTTETQPVEELPTISNRADPDFGPDDETVEQPAPNTPDVKDVQWHASEYIQHEKSTMWYGVLAAITVVSSLGLIIFMKDYTFATLIVVMAIAIVVYARRPPRDVQYVIDRQGININGILHPFESFKAFTITSEEAFFSLQLTPLKRFRPPVVLYFAQDDGERIVDALGAHIPLQPVKHDIIEQFSRFIRF